MAVRSMPVCVINSNRKVAGRLIKGGGLTPMHHMKTKTALRLKSLRYHKALVWLAAAGLLIFGLSGLTHPLMMWTGPRPAAFFPPQAVMQAAQVAALPQVLARNDVNTPLLVKLVPSGHDVLLQVTEAHDAPRRYFDPETGMELSGHDIRHAIDLARYYSGLSSAEVASVDFQTSFDNAYPWVNRLLPVYRVQFATADNRVVYIHTELNAMAAITNDWKTTLQSVFGFLHTWSFLDSAEALRVAAMLLLVLSLLALTLAGCVLVFTLAKRPQASASRRWHRRLSYILWLPLLAFTASGSYHLLQYSLAENNRGLRLPEPLPLEGIMLEPSGAWLARYQGQAFNALSLVAGEGGALFYRLGIPQMQTQPAPQAHEHHAMPSTKQRFDGMAAEKTALYVDAATGEETALDDRAMAEHLASRFNPEQQITVVDEIRAFSPAYDFRNKRLPAWQVEFASGDTLFVDTVSGALIDRIRPAEKIENYVFSHAHKWGFIGDIIGRMARDILMFFVFVGCFALLAFGLLLKTRKRP